MIDIELGMLLLVVVLVGKGVKSVGERGEKQEMREGEYYISIIIGILHKPKCAGLHMEKGGTIIDIIHR